MRLNRHHIPQKKTQADRGIKNQSTGLFSKINHTVHSFTAKRVMAGILSAFLMLTFIPTAAFAETTVATIGAVEYASLELAVEAANAGDLIMLTATDETVQQITIDKSLTIELNGFDLPSTAIKISSGTVAIGDRKGKGTMNAQKARGFVATELSRCSSTLYVTGDAQVSLNNVNINESASDDLVKPIFLGGTTSQLTINGGRFIGTQKSGRDGLYFYNNDGAKLIINDGYFEANCGLSVNSPVTGKSLVIRKATFKGPAGGFYIEGYGGVKNEDKAKEFLSASGDSSIKQPFKAKEIIIISGLFLSDGFTGGEYGSTDPANPGKLTPEVGDSIILQPQILGGNGEIPTYEWKHNGVTLPNETAPTLEIASYQPTVDDGNYTLTVTPPSGDPVDIYFQIGDAGAPPVEGEAETAQGTLEEAFDTVKTSGGTISLLDNVTRELAEGESTPFVIDSTFTSPIILDLNGKTLAINSVANNSAFTAAVIAAENTGLFTITDSSAEKTGKISVTNGFAVYAQDASVKLSGGSYTAGGTLGGVAIDGAVAAFGEDEAAAKAALNTLLADGYQYNPDTVGFSELGVAHTATTVTVTKPVAPVSAITITVKESGGSPVDNIGGTSLSDAVSVSKIDPDMIEELTVTAGKVTEADWKWMKTNIADLQKKRLVKFTVEKAVASVANIPDTANDTTSLFPNTLESVNIANLQFIGKFAFFYCEALTEAIFPDAMKIGYGAFNYCSALTGISFPKAFDIGSHAFYGCEKLTSVNFPMAEGMTQYAFGNCTLLSSASFPKMANIGEDAFNGCTNLAELKLGSTLSKANNHSFNGCPADRTLKLVTADGAPLTESTTPKLSAVQAAYDKVVSPDVGTPIDGLWFGWKVREPAPPTEVSYHSAVADGTETFATSRVVLNFSTEIEGFTAANITLTDTDTTGATKGALTPKGSGVYELALSGVTKNGSISVGVAVPGYLFTPASQTTAVFRTPAGDIGGSVTDEDSTKPVAGVTVKLMKGGTKGTEQGSTITDKDGKFSFKNIPYGSYSLVATLDEHTTTKAIGINTTNITANIVMLSGSKDTVVAVKADTPSVAVDNLGEMFTPADDVIANTNGQSVTIKLEVEKKEKSAVPAADVAKIKAALSVGQTVGIYIDAKLLRTTTGTGADVTDDPIQPPAGEKIKMVMDIPANLWGKASYSVVRVHEGEVATLAATYDAVLHTLTFEGDKFSTYSVVFSDTKPVDPPKPPTDNTITDGGSGGNYYYYYGNEENDFWTAVTNDIWDAYSGDIIRVDAKYYDRMPVTVLDALNGKNVTLVIQWNNGDTFSINGTKMKATGNWFYFPLAMLEQLYRAAPAATTTDKPTSSAPIVAPPLTGGEVIENAEQNPAETATPVAPIENEKNTPKDVAEGQPETAILDKKTGDKEAVKQVDTPAKSQSSNEIVISVILVVILLALAGIGLLLWKNKGKADEK